MDAKASNRYMLRTTAVIAVGQMCTKAVNFFLLPLYTALISAEVYGTVDLLSTLSGLLVVVVNLQLEQTIFRFVSTKRNDSEVAGEILSTVYALSGGLCALYAALFLALGWLMPVEGSWYLLPSVIGSVYLASMTNTARGMGHNTTYALANFVSATSIILLNLLVLVLLKLPAINVLWAYAAGPFLGGTTALVLEKPWKLVEGCRPSKARARELVSYAVPLVPNELSWWVVRTSDRVIISVMLGTAANGLLAVADRFTAIYSTVFGIFNMAWVEQCFIHYKQEGGKEYLGKTMAQALRLFACGTLLLISAMPLLYVILINGSYAEGYELVAPYLIAAFLNVIVGLISPIYLINNETKIVARTTVEAAIINAVSNPILVLLVGVYAGPLSSIIGYLFIVLRRVVDINRRHMTLPVNRAFFVRLGTAGAAVLLAYYSANGLFQALGFVVATSYAWFECRGFAKAMVDMVRNRGGHSGTS